MMMYLRIWCFSRLTLLDEKVVGTTKGTFGYTAVYIAIGIVLPYGAVVSSSSL